LLLLVALGALQASGIVRAQAGLCSSAGSPSGTWAICVDPWSPAEGAPFGINFSGPCSGSSLPHQFQVQRSGDTWSIYYDYVQGFCPGVPTWPRYFTTQAGVSVGEYRVRLYRRESTSTPFPPFYPAVFTLEREVTFTVRGAPQAVPVGGLLVWIVLALSVLASVRIRQRRCGSSTSR
jgi:hypothetical protein